MIELKLIDTVLLIVSAFILRVFLNCFFEYRIKSIFFDISIWTLYVILQIVVAAVIPKNQYTTVGRNICLILFITLVAYVGKLHKKIMFALLFMVIWILSESILSYLYPVFGVSASYVYGATLSKAILFILVQILIVAVKGKNNVNIPIKYWIILLVIPVFSLAVIFSLYTITQSKPEPKVAIAFLFISVVMMFINFIIFIIYFKMADNMIIERENSLYEQQLKLCGLQVSEREEAMLEIRKVRHDMKNHLIYLREMIDINEKEKSMNYLNDIIMDINLERIGISRSGNVVIDSLVNYKYSIACKEQIDFKINIMVPYKIPYNDGDICIILGNALDNAIEASCKLEPNERAINLTMGARKNVLSIVIKNKYNGIIKADKNHKYLTSKMDTVNHGIGIMSIRKSVSKYNGVIDIDESNNEFTLSILLYNIEEAS